MKNLDNLSVYLNLLDAKNIGQLPYSIFKQAATDNDIRLTDQEYQYIVKKYCDHKGNVNYIRITDRLELDHALDVHGKKYVKWGLKGIPAKNVSIEPKVLAQKVMK